MSRCPYIIAAGYFSLVNLLTRRDGVYILMYHHVHDELPPSKLVMSVETFRMQMRYLKKYCDVLDIRQLEKIYVGKEPIPRRRRPQVVITIDDGYRDTYLNAFPVLKEFDLPATVFLATGLIGTDKKIQSPDWMNWEEAAAMREHKITMGPHTVNHPHLPELSYAEQKAEIEGSMKDISMRVPDEIVRTVFCYPYGQYNQDTLRVMRDLGVKIALTVKGGINTKSEDPIQLKRVCADGTHSAFDFMQTINVSLIPGIKWRADVVKDKLKKIFGLKRGHAFSKDHD